MGLCKVEKGRTYSLKDFSEAQFSQLQEVSLFSQLQEVSLFSQLQEVSSSQVSQHVCFTYSEDGHAILLYLLQYLF